MNIIQYFKSQIHLSDKEIQFLLNSVKRKKIRKKDLILPVENTSKNVFFIEEGVARVFYAKKDKDITLYFLDENNIGLPVDSIFYNQICKFGIEALAETTVAIIPYDHWEQLAEHNIELQKFSQKLMIDYVKNSTDRIYNLKFQTPKERFESLLEDFPSIFLKVPLGHIASYLGITQETLSRLRAQK